MEGVRVFAIRNFDATGRSMKTIPISMLVLIAFPIHLVGQEFSDFKSLGTNELKPKVENYFADRNAEIASSANHIMSTTRRSNRKGATAQDQVGLPVVSPSLQLSVPSKVDLTLPNSAPVVSLQASKAVEFSSIPVEPLQLEVATSTPLAEVANNVVEFSAPKAPVAEQTSISGGDFSPDRLANRIALAPFKPLETSGFKPLRMASSAEPVAPEERAWQDIEVSPSDIVVEEESIVRPTPQNTEPTAPATTTPSRPLYTVESSTSEPVQSIEPPVDNTYAGEPYVVSEADSTSLDHLQMAQRVNSWEKQPSTMRHITDHFSPGGEPFAYRGPVGDTNFFGIDRHSVCDEWAGTCNCSGGLKATRGHLGLPWLKSKDACDTTELRRGRLGTRCESDCGCSTCSQ